MYVAYFLLKIVVLRPVLINAHFLRVHLFPHQFVWVSFSVVMADDLAKLPGDDDLEPKRRGLRRLRKAERVFLKQQQQKKQAGAGAEETGVPSSTDSRGKGRQWDSRRWRASGLSDLARVVLAAAIATTHTTGGGSTATAVDFSAVLERLTATDAAAKVVGEAGDEKSAVDAAAAAPPPGQGASGKGGKKGKGAATAAKGKEAAKGPTTTEGDGEDEEAAAARRQKEEREADVKAWAEGLREALEGETFVTTAHRVAVAARDTIVSGLADRSKVQIGPTNEELSAGARGFHSNQLLTKGILTQPLC